MSLTRKKSLASLLAQASESHLKRTLTAKSLVALGIGAIIGAGLFIRTAAAAARTRDRPSSYPLSSVHLAASSRDFATPSSPP